MHFEVLVEDQSGKRALDILIPKIVGDTHSFRVIAYKGIGHVPKNMKTTSEAKKRSLLNQLPRLLQGYGKTFESFPEEYPAAVVLVCDLDDKCLKAFREELHTVLSACNPRPCTRFCIAIEEGEAWFLGDLTAIRKAYPSAKSAILNTYENDSICGTWEKLANAVYHGGAAALTSMGRQAIGREKSRWAGTIPPHMDVDENNSPSFVYFREKMRELARGKVVLDTSSENGI